jgi:4-amino-4-deoxy-L-arabinose transferase-like glycosyltransferase
MAVCAGLAVVITLDAPGLTVDEPLDVRPGRKYLEIAGKRGWHFFDRDVVELVFRDNAEHPPLGRWLLGIASVLGEPFEVLLKGADPTGTYVLAGRLAPALAIACLVGLVVHEGERRWGRPAGVGAGTALILMPRVFAHAHLGALDTFLSLFWTLGLIAGDRAIHSRRPVIAMTVAGAVWALALLTKIHAWLLAPLVVIWALRSMPFRRAIPALAAWFAAGVTLYFVGWPWLWYDSLHRFLAYWGTGVARASIQVQYFGRVMADRDVPWHYPWFYFFVTVPLGLHALAALGLARGFIDRRAESFTILLAASITLFLVLFSTRIPVYDGERLFLHTFPAWALLAGKGFGWLWNHPGMTRNRRAILGAFLLAQGYGVVAFHPFQLSYYNAAVGGLRGAERLGLELTYWGDAVDQVLLDRLARDAKSGASAALVPTLYPGQGIFTTTRALARRNVILADDGQALSAEWLVISRRTAYWRTELEARLQAGGGHEVARRARQGVWLSALWNFPQSASQKPVATSGLPDSRRPPRDGQPPGSPFVTPPH